MLIAVSCALRCKDTAKDSTQLGSTLRFTKRSATVNRSRVSIRIAKILASAKFWGAVDSVKVFLSFSLITVQNLVAVSHVVCARVRGPKFGGIGARPLGMGRG